MPSAPVPAYASACSAPARYSSAYSCFGYPATTTSTPTPTATCVTQSDATTIVNGFVNLLTNTQAKFNTSLANSLLADNFQDFSDSIDYLLELPLGSATFPSKRAFSQGQGTQPPIPSVTALNLYHIWNIIAWQFQLNTIPLPVRGINLFVINSAKQIETVYDELNSGTYLYNIGRPECQANWTVSVAS